MEGQDALRFLQAEVARLRDENQDLKQELTVLHSSVRALSAMQDLLQRLSPGVDILAMLRDLLESALAVVGAGGGSLMLVDEDSGELVFAVVHGLGSDRLKGYRLPAGRGIAGWVVEHKQAQVVRDVQADPRFYPTIDETFGFQTRTLAAVPLMDGTRVLGVIEAINKSSDREFSSQDHDLLMVVAELSAVFLLRADSFA